jgi:hypothetical protein
MGLGEELERSSVWRGGPTNFFSAITDRPTILHTKVGDEGDDHIGLGTWIFSMLYMWYFGT